MSFRGFGGFGGVSYGRRRPRAGDLFSGGGVESADPFGIGTLDDGSGSSDGSPDFSDVSGGSSTMPMDIQSMGLGGFQLPDVGTAIQRIMNPTGYQGGSSAAAGLAAAAAPAVAKAVRKHVARLMGSRGTISTHRRMNPGNFKALRRSMRRLMAFERAARHVIKFTHPRPHARVKFKFPKRRRRT